MKPLEDLRIRAIERYGAGPFGSVHLADVGAEAMKMEDPASGGDVARYVPPYQEGEDSLFFEDFEVGDIYEHALGRTVTQTDNAWFTLLTLNTAALHFDHQYAAQTEFGVRWSTPPSPWRS